jgi:hypothetical protein
VRPPLNPLIPNGWDDNYLCSPQPLDFYWSFAGPLAGLHCVQFLEAADPNTWNDNFLCSSRDYGMEWSSAGPLPGRSCIRVNEPADPNSWNDNFLCFSKALLGPVRVRLQWSNSGSMPGLHCVAITEPADPHTWTDNFLCSPQGLGLRWSFNGPIANMNCVRIHEAADPHAWHDNYLCAVKDFGMEWSSAGPLPGRSCLQISEPADPHTWHDNFLCFSKATVVAPPASTAVCAGLPSAPVTTITGADVDAAQRPGRQLIGLMLHNKVDALLLVVDDAPGLGPDQMRVELDLDGGNVILNKAIEGRTACGTSRTALVEAAFAGGGFGVATVCAPLDASNDVRSVSGWPFHLELFRSDPDDGVHLTFEVDTYALQIGAAAAP